MKKKLEKLSTFIVPINCEEKKQTFIKLLLSSVTSFRFFFWKDWLRFTFFPFWIMIEEKRRNSYE